MHDHVTGLRLTHLAGALRTTVFFQNTRCNPLLTRARLINSKTLNLSFEGETRTRSGRHIPAGDGPSAKGDVRSVHPPPPSLAGRRWWLGERNRPNTHTPKNSFFRARAKKKKGKQTHDLTALFNHRPDGHSASRGWPTWTEAPMGTRDLGCRAGGPESSMTVLNSHMGWLK